jgi:hypothetical protein
MEVSDRDRTKAFVENALRQAVSEGWEARSAAELEGGFEPSGRMREMLGFDWLIRSVKYDLGDYRLRLMDDLNILAFVHSTHFHVFPADIEEATLIRLDAFTTSSLSRLISDLMAKRKPNLVHPT